jgi:hypothetical protein
VDGDVAGDVADVQSRGAIVKRLKCRESGSIVGSREAARYVRCSCGFTVTARPRFDRRVAGEVVLGWTAKIPAHLELPEVRS